MPDDDQRHHELIALHAEMCKVFSHPARLHILNVLRDQELSVSDLAERLDLPLGSLSQHLLMMKERRALVSRKNGNHVLYRVANPRLIEVFDLIRDILNEQIRADAALLPPVTPTQGQVR